MADRTCARCGASSTEVPFKRDKRAADGLGAYCLECQREYNREHYKANRERRNAQTRAHYEANRDATLTQQREYRAANIDAIRQRDRERYAADPQGRSAHVARWKIANSEAVRDYFHDRYSSDRDRFRDAEDFRRVAAAGFDATCEPIARRDVWEAWGRSCGICGDPIDFEDMELDHIRPISKGGSHTWDNVQPAHKPCNSGKRDREE